MEDNDKKLWEIINPSDAYTFEAAEREVAALVVLGLGSGQYGGDCGDDAARIPILIFGGATEWYEREFGRDMGAGLVARETELPIALDSVMIGSRSERARMDRVLAAVEDEEDRQRARVAWLDERRSSMNDIGARAAKWAANLRAKSAVPVPAAPQQVFVA